MKDAIFNPLGEKLWITVKMTGLYYMTYNYFLWGTGSDSPPILTNPIKSNNNKILIDDYYNIVNDHKPGEALSSYHERVAQVSLDVITLSDDIGYEVTVSSWQCTEDQVKDIIQNLYSSAYVPPVAPLSEEIKSGKVGTSQMKEVKFYINFKDTTK